MRGWSLPLVLLVVLLPCAAATAADLREALYVMRRDGSQVRRVAKVGGYHEHGFPSWSHDGARLIFDAIPTGGGPKKLFVVNVDGTGLQEAGPGETADFSPDDKQIVLHSEGDGRVEAGLYVQNLDGQGSTRLAAGYGPRWSPDGAQLAFSVWNGFKVLDMVTLEPRNLIAEPVQLVMPGCDWSPDGKRLAVVVRVENQRELWLVTVDGSAPPRKRLRQNLDGRVSWSPDGSRLAISSNRKIYLLDPDGRGTQMLPDQRGESVEPAWSPDGRWLAVSGNHPQAK